MPNLKMLTLIALATLFLASGCTPKKDDEKTEKPSPPEAREVFHVFSFDGAMGSRYMMHFTGSGDQAILYTHGETLPMTHQAAASGAKYQGERLMVWIKGDEVLMEVDGQRVGPCKVSGLQSILSTAWLSGTDFWAVGNEPSWNLIMGRDRVVLLTEMGQKKTVFPGLEEMIFDPQKPYGTYVFINDEKHELEIEILEGRCTDTMSGEPFAVSVRLVLDGQEMLGCGTGLF